VAVASGGTSEIGRAADRGFLASGVNKQAIRHAI
jgi:hypothetical protein